MRDKCATTCSVCARCHTVCCVRTETARGHSLWGFFCFILAFSTCERIIMVIRTTAYIFYIKENPIDITELLVLESLSASADIQCKSKTYLKTCLGKTAFN